MDKSAIRNFSIEARKILMKSAETEAGFYGVTRKGCKSPIQKGNDFEVYETLAGTENRIYGADIKKRANLVEAVETLGFDQVIEETAYTWFNRIIAIRFMEVNGYLPTRVRVLSSEMGSNTPDIVTQFLDVDLNMTPEELEKVQKAKDENRYDDAFRMLFVKQCNELNAILPGLFEKTDDYMELLLKLSYTSDGVVRMLVDTVAEDNFNVETEGQVEIIGWMYQYYNTELKDDTFAQLKKNVKITKERIPAATQLFTPDWIVRYMVENSVGRVWIEHLRAINPSIDEKEKAEEFGWKYYLPEAEQEDEVSRQLVEIRKCYLNLEPKDITCIDPCMGSGHILVYMFDVLMDVYRSEGFSERDAAFSILENNIRGLDIDRRAYQLSYFALMMKARGYNRTFFRGVHNADGERKYIEPVVFAIEESNDTNRNQLKYFGAELSEIDKNNAINQMTGLLDSLIDAKEYGSILDIEKYDWNLLDRFVSTENTEGQISFDTYEISNTQKKLRKLVAQGEVMSEKYLVVSTNPPYMAIGNSSNQINSFVKKKYPDSKADLFAVFIEKAIKLLKKNGFQSMITQHAWMFLSSYEDLRMKLKKNYIVNMAHLGTRAFDEIGGEVVQTTSFVYRYSMMKNYKATYMRLLDGNSQSQKEKMFLEKSNLYISSQEKYIEIPGMPIAYWISNDLVETFKNPSLDSLGESYQGIITGDVNKYLKVWYEIPFDHIKFGENNYKVLENVETYYPYIKGGSYRKWAGNLAYVLKWEKNGSGLTRSRTENRPFFFKKGVTWSLITTSDMAFRYVPQGFLCDVSGSSYFPRDEKHLLYIIGFLNSKVSAKILNVINPTINLNVKDILMMPLKEVDVDNISKLVQENIDICKTDWDTYETSWNYVGNMLVKKCDTKIDGRISTFVNEIQNNVETQIRRLKENEEIINKHFINIYGLNNELTADVSEESLSIRYREECDYVKELVSYSVGCMFGRYSLFEDGLRYSGGEGCFDTFSEFIPDRDNIVPITDEDYFKDDIVNRFIEWVTVVFGEQYLNENMEYITDALKIKGKTFKEKIRYYFLNDFYKDHCNMYSVMNSGKRPIYWLFDSGKENGFKCLIYMHRYTKDTLNLIRSEYLHKTEDVVENALKNVEYIIQTSSSAVEKAKATKDRDKYVKQLNEMRTYYQALSHLAIQKIEIDLDDGVKNNYQIFQGIEVIADGGKKQKVDLLAKI